MTILRDLAGVLLFDPTRLRALAARRALIFSVVFLVAGFLTFVLIRNSVYADLREDLQVVASPGVFDQLLHLNVVQLVVFLSVVYMPAVICLSNAIAGDGLGLTVSREEYQTQLSALFPLWGLLLILTAPLQLVLPQFIVLGPFGISIGLLVLASVAIVYTVWAIRELNFVSTVAALGVFTISWVTLPIYYVLTAFLFALPLFIMLPLLYITYQRLRTHLGGRENERSFYRHLEILTINPQDADAQHQLGLIYLRRHAPEVAVRYFEAAVRIDPSLPDYHYYLGRAHEARGDWPAALEQYEETYRADPEFAQGDIFREVGKAYLHTGKTEKAIEFLQFFLGTRGSDPEGRFWLAMAFKDAGKPDDMRAQLNTILDQARSQPRFFRKGNREWVHRSRMMLRRP